MNLADLFVSLKLGGVNEAAKGLKDVLANLKAVEGAVPDLQLDAQGLDQVMARLKDIGDALKNIATETKDFAEPIQSPKALLADITEKPKAILADISQRPKESLEPITPLQMGKQNNDFIPRLKETTKNASSILKEFFGQTLPNKAQDGIKMMGAGLKSLASLSFEAKAAIVGALYAFQQLISNSNQAGTSLNNFSQLTGISAQTLQKYQYAANQVGVSNEAMQSTFESLQSQMTKVAMGQGTPAGFAQFASVMGGITKEDVDEFMKNPELLLLKLQEYAQKEKRIGIRNEVLSSFVGKDVASALAQNAFRPDVFAKAPVYSDKEVKTLARVAAIWRNMGTQIQKAVGHFNAINGEKISILLQSVVNMGLKAGTILLQMIETMKNGKSSIASFVTSFADIANQSGIMTSIGNTFEKTGNSIGKLLQFLDTLLIKFGALKVILETVNILLAGISTIVEGLGQLFEVLGGKDPLSGQKVEPKEKFDYSKLIPKISTDDFSFDKLKTQLKFIFPTEAPNMPGSKDLVPKVSTQNNTSTNSFNVQQTLNFPNSGNPKDTGESVKRAVNEAFRQYSAQIQGN